MIPLLLGVTLILIMVTGIVLDLSYIFVAINKCHTALSISARAAAKQIDWDKYSSTGNIEIIGRDALEKFTHLLKQNLNLDSGLHPEDGSIVNGQVTVILDVVEREIAYGNQVLETVPGVKVTMKVPIELHFLAFIRPQITVPVEVTVVTIGGIQG